MGRNDNVYGSIIIWEEETCRRTGSQVMPSRWLDYVGRLFLILYRSRMRLGAKNRQCPNKGNNTE